MFACNENQSSQLTMLVGTYTDTDSKGIYILRFDENSGKAVALNVTEVQNPSFLAIDMDNKYIYSVSEQVNGAASSFNLDTKTGTLKPEGSKLTKAAGPCHISFIGNEAVTANYSSGTLSIFPVKKNHHLGEAKVIQFNENGPDSIRQDHSHLHSTQVTPDGKYLFAIDLGGDCIYRFTIKNKLIANTNPVKINVPTGSGPRHFDFSPDGKFMYLINELSGSIIAYIYNDGNLNQIQEIQSDTLYARGSADIHISPDGKFLYTSNRLKRDGIAIFKRNINDGKLEKVYYQLTGIHPRYFIITPNGKYLLVACRDSNIIQVFLRNEESGMLEDTHQDIKISHPVCIKFVK